jgi:GNAT superfamily N-acetyltransferase
MFHVRNMSEKDIEFAVHITDQMGWGLSEDDFRFMMELEPKGCFVLFFDSERVGIATTIGFGEVGWFGNLIVSEDYRKQGAGSLLVEHSIKHLRSKNTATVGLYAYMDRMPFYKRLGFHYDSNFVVLKGKGFSSPTQANLRKAKKQDIPAIVKYDELCFGASRRKLLEPILLDPDNLCYISFEDGRIQGYAIAKVYRGMAELGPLGCVHDPSGTAIKLLKATLNSLKGFEVSMFVPEGESGILNMLLKAGFHEKFRVARMFFGSLNVKNCVYLAESLERG